LADSQNVGKRVFSNKKTTEKSGADEEKAIKRCDDALQEPTNQQRIETQEAGQR
jgi:hypothetical protein